MKPLIADVRRALDRPLEAATTLFAVRLFAASAEMVMHAIETAVGYFVGSTARTPSKASVLRFAEAYLPELGRVSPGADLALADHPNRPLESVAELLYEGFHGGLFHDDGRPAGVHCLDSKKKWMVSVEPDGSAKLNVLPLHCQFERGMKQFLRDLARDDGLLARAATRAAFLAHPIVIRMEPQMNTDQHR